MRPVDALVAEVVADLVHAFESAHNQPLEIQLVRDPQIQRHVERVVVRDERTRRRTAIQRLQHRRFDFEIVQPIEMRADAAGEHRTGAEERAHLGMHRQIGITLSRPLFGVGEPGIAHHLPIYQLLLTERQWPQRLREEGGHVHLHGGFAGLRTHHRPPHANPVAEVPGIELGPGRFADLIAPEVQLDAPVHVRQVGERRLALAAPRGEAARHRDIGSLIRCAKRGHRFRGRMRSVERVGERFDTRRAQHLELVATRLHQEIQIFAHSGRPSAFSSLSCFR